MADIDERRWPDRDVARGLRYIADSPPQRYGGFHPEAVRAAREALRLIRRLRRRRREARP